MKKILALLLCLITVFSLCACDLMGGRTLKGTMDLPEDGILTAKQMEDLKNEKGVVTVKSSSNGFDYEWKLFGEDVGTPADINLSCAIEQAEDGLSVTFASDHNFDFCPVLSIALKEKWDAQVISVYQDGNKIADGSVTGEDPLWVNFQAKVTTGTLIIKPEEQLSGISDETAKSEEETTAPTETTAPLETTEPLEATEPSATATPSQNAAASTNTTPPETTTPPGISDGTQTGQDQYLTDPVPEGKPLPVEPGENTGGTKQLTCVFSIECSTILNNLDELDPAKLDMVPSNGVILEPVVVTFTEGESVFDVLQRVCQQYGIHMESEWTPMYNSAYIEGIHNLYEFDCGSLSGWMYRVNGWYPNYGCSRYALKQGDVVEWRYTCDLGHDVGDNYLG